jgi:hypothetical protein
MLKQQAELEYELRVANNQSVPNIHKGSRIKRPFGQLNSMLVQFGNVWGKWIKWSQSESGERQRPTWCQYV